MRKLFTICMLLFTGMITLVHAQDADTASTKPAPEWNIGWVGNINGSQAAYSNWSQGGVNSLAVTASSVFKAKLKKNKYSYRLNVNLKYGQTRLQSQGVRKTDDLIEITNKWEYLLDDSHYSAYGQVNFKTQFDKGYDYEKDPAVLISKFFAPAYFIESAGLSYQPTDYFTSQAGLALKQTIVSDTSLSTLYGVMQGKQFRSEGGFTLELNLDKEIFKNMKYSGSVTTFTNFLTPIIKATDVTWSNELTGKINSFLSANVQFVTMYDRDVSSALQVKQVIAIGINFTIL